jgi:hypothetical protein
MADPESRVLAAAPGEQSGHRRTQPGGSYPVRPWLQHKKERGRDGVASATYNQGMKPEIKRSVVIPLKFTTTDGQELPLQDYAAVPRELLRKLEEIAIRARELIAAHKAAILGGTSNMVEKAMSDLTKDLSALEEIWDFEASCISRLLKSAPLKVLSKWF